MQEGDAVNTVRTKTQKHIGPDFPLSPADIHHRGKSCLRHLFIVTFILHSKWKTFRNSPREPTDTSTSSSALIMAADVPEVFIYHYSFVFSELKFLLMTVIMYQRRRWRGEGEEEGGRIIPYPLKIYFYSLKAFLLLSDLSTLTQLWQTQLHYAGCFLTDRNKEDAKKLYKKILVFSLCLRTRREGIEKVANVH